LGSSSISSIVYSETKDSEEVKAWCLWDKEIFNIYIKPTVDSVIFGIIPMLTIIDSLKYGLNDGHLSEERDTRILIIKNRNRFARLANLPTD